MICDLCHNRATELFTKLRKAPFKNFTDKVLNDPLTCKLPFINDSNCRFGRSYREIIITY